MLHAHPNVTIEITDTEMMVINKAYEQVPFMVTVTIKGSAVDRKPDLEVSDFVSANCVRVGYKQINGYPIHEYVYSAKAAHKGIARIGPVSVMIDGSLHKIEPVTIEVVENIGMPSRGSGNQSKTGWVELSVDNQHPFVGQETEVKLALYTRQQPERITKLEIPNIPSFEPVGEFQQSQHKVVINGTAYYCTEIRWSVIARQEGTYMFPAGSISFIAPSSNRSFFSLWEGEQKQLFSNTVHVETESLPEYNGTDRCIGVGKDFTISASVDKTTVTLNDVLKYTVTISSSEKSIGAISSIPLNSMGTTWRMYPSRVYVPDQLLGGQSVKQVSPSIVKKSFEYVVQPLASGKHSIPAQSFVYFDTGCQRYKELKVASVSIDVLPAEDAGSNSTNDQEKVISGRSPVSELMPANNSESTASLAQNKYFCNEDGEWCYKQAVWVLPWLIFFILCAFVPAAAFAWLLFCFAYAYLQASTLSRRYRKAFSIARKRWQAVRAGGDVSHLYMIFVQLFADKYKVPIGTVSQSAIQIWLRNAQIDEEKIAEFDLFMAQLAASVYGGIKQANSTTLFLQAEQWIYYLEKKL